MTAWTSDELTRIGSADELRIAPLQRDGSARKSVIVWVVRHADSLYVRSVKGPSAAWYRGTRARHEGHINAGGVQKDVTFVDADHDIDDELDAEYRTKYRRYAASIIGHIVSPAARSTTIRLEPR